MFRTFALMLFVVPVFFLAATGNPSQAQADLMDFETDTTWRAIGPIGSNEHVWINYVGAAWEASNPGWNDSLAYDDAAWTDAIYNGHPVIPNSIWVSGDSRTGPTPAYFRKTIEITGNPVAASVDLWLDDDIQLYVNGNLVLNDDNGTAEQINNVNLMPYLVAGTNLIAAKAHDHQRNEGIYGAFTITYNLDPVPEPSTLVLLSFGLVGLAAYGVRRRQLQK